MFGGVYYLGKGVSSLVMKDGTVTGVVIENKKISCKQLLLPSHQVPQELISSDSDPTDVSRAIYVTSQSILPSDKEQITFLSLPQDTGPGIHVIEVGAGAAATPRGLHLLHVSGSRDLDLGLVAQTNNLISDDSVVYSLRYTQCGVTSVTTPGSGVWAAAGPQHELDFDKAIENARNIYSEMYPGEEFLPRAPDPEEIVFGEEGSESVENAAEENISENKDKEQEHEESIENKESNDNKEASSDATS